MGHIGAMPAPETLWDVYPRCPSPVRSSDATNVQRLAVSKFVPGRGLRQWLIDLSNRVNLLLLPFLRGSHPSPVDR